MSEGRLAPVRETDRHAAVVAGCAAALFSGSSFAALHAMNVNTDLGGASARGATASFPFQLAVSVLMGFGVGCVEGAIASRAARTAADRFHPLRPFARKVFTYAAITNASVAVIATSIAFSGSDRIVAVVFSVIVAVAGSAVGAALFAWSHALDWPHVPDYLRAKPSAQPRPVQPQQPPEVDTHTVDIDAGRREVVNEPRSRRNPSSSIDDDVRQEIQDLITGK